MNQEPPPEERIKLHEAIGAFAIIAFATFSLTVMVAFLAARCYIEGIINLFRKKRNHHV